MQQAKALKWSDTYRAPGVAGAHALLDNGQRIKAGDAVEFRTKLGHYIGRVLDIDPHAVHPIRIDYKGADTCGRRIASFHPGEFETALLLNG